MEFTDFFPAALAGSSFEEPLAALHGLYAEVDAACSSFLSAARDKDPGFGCPQGCGACCERFVPDILPAEADYAALWILRYAPELASVEQRDIAPCPYYAADKPEAHCRIYGGRPLICRLFGYTSVGTKNGSLSYSLCWSMPGLRGSELRSWTGEELARAFGRLPSPMADYGLRLQALSAPASSSGKPLLGKAIRDSIDRFRFILSLSGGAD